MCRKHISFFFFPFVWSHCFHFAGLLAGLWEFPCIKLEDIDAAQDDKGNDTKRKSSGQQKLKAKCIDLVKEKYSMVLSENDLCTCGQVK